MLAFVLAAGVWADARYWRPGSESTTTTITRKPRAQAALARCRTVKKAKPRAPRNCRRLVTTGATVVRVGNAAGGETDSVQSLVVALLGAAAIFLACAAFFWRISKFGAFGVTFELFPALVRASRRLRDSAQDAETADRLAHNVEERLKKRAKREGGLDAQAIDEATDAVLAETQTVPAREIDVEATADAVVVRIDVQPQVEAGRLIRVTTVKPSFMPGAPWYEQKRDELEAAGIELGRCFWADHADTGIVAALSYDLGVTEADPIRILVLINDPDPPAADVVTLATGELLAYLDALAEKVKRPRGVVLRLDNPEASELRWLSRFAFEVAGEEEADALGGGLYWRHRPR